jgi:hypothetical protein
LQIVQDDTASFLTGNLQMYSPETMEPNQPMYLSLRKVTNTTLETSERFSVYPNPFEDGLNISFYQVEFSAVQVAVFTTSGQRVYLESLGTLPEGQQDITLKLSLKAGVYVLKVFTGKKAYQTVVVHQ